jgi:protein-disulfide isomerase
MKIRIGVRIPLFLATLLALMMAGAPAAETPAKITKAMGTPIAGITIEIFSDFQCPMCKMVHETWIHPLIDNYVRTGRAYLIQHEYPLPMHAYARTAACYACAAERVGKYGEVGDILFKKQQEWEKDGKVEEAACSVLTPAEAAKVRALAKDPAIVAEVQKDVDLGMQNRVNATPTVFVTYKGRRYPVDVRATYASFARFLDSLH